MENFSGEDKHILVAVDEGEGGKRAVLYVANFLGGIQGFRVTVLHIVAEPPEDYFGTDKESEEWRKNRESEGSRMVGKYRQILIQSGFAEEKVATSVVLRRCRSLAECIFEEVNRLNACTVVVGRRGISLKEEFLLGSTSSRLLHTARNCAVWVVE